MTAREMQSAGMLYTLDDDLWQQHLKSKRITRALNATLETENDKRRELVQQLFGSAGEGSYIEPPFYCDYGCNTHVGKYFYCSYDCAFLDCGRITLGDRVMLGPKVGLYAVNHPIDPEVRATGLEYAKPITIGDNVWIGGSATVCPGAVIGSNVVIGAGSVIGASAFITKSVPPCTTVSLKSQELQMKPQGNCTGCNFCPENK